jgi:uncharacterized membrane protein
MPVNVGWSERKVSAVAGGVLVLLGLSRRSLGGLLTAGVGGALLHRATTGRCALYSALGVDTASNDEPATPEEYFNRAIHVEQSVTIAKPASELFDFWRNFTNLPKFMHYLDAVTCSEDGKRSHWVAKGPGGMQVQWDAEIINEEPNRLIAWRSLGGAEVDNAGSVRFISAPGERGTEVKVVIDYIPPAGRVGWAVAKLFGRDPAVEVREDLRRFRQLMETGEVPTTDGQPRGTCSAASSAS